MRYWLALMALPLMAATTRTVVVEIRDSANAPVTGQATLRLMGPCTDSSDNWGTDPLQITYSGLTSIQSGDRAVITLQLSAFSPAGAGSMSAAIEYGDNNATPLDSANVDAAGHPFIALYVWRAKLERFDPDQYYTRFRGAAHAPERFILGSTPASPFLGEMFLGE